MADGHVMDTRHLVGECPRTIDDADLGVRLQGSDRTERAAERHPAPSDHRVPRRPRQRGSGHQARTVHQIRGTGALDDDLVDSDGRDLQNRHRATSGRQMAVHQLVDSKRVPLERISQTLLVSCRRQRRKRQEVEQEEHDEAGYSEQGEAPHAPPRQVRNRDGPRCALRYWRNRWLRGLRTYRRIDVGLAGGGSCLFDSGARKRGRGGTAVAHQTTSPS